MLLEYGIQRETMKSDFDKIAEVLTGIRLDWIPVAPDLTGYRISCQHCHVLVIKHIPLSDFDELHQEVERWVRSEFAYITKTDTCIHWQRFLELEVDRKEIDDFIRYLLWRIEFQPRNAVTYIKSLEETQ